MYYESLPWLYLLHLPAEGVAVVVGMLRQHELGHLLCARLVEVRRRLRLRLGLRLGLRLRLRLGLGLGLS